MTRLNAPKQLENIFICTAICRDQQWSANKQKKSHILSAPKFAVFSLLLFPTHNATWERAKLRPTDRIPRAPAINWAAAGVEIRGKPRNRQSRRARRAVRRENWERIKMPCGCCCCWESEFRSKLSSSFAVRWDLNRMQRVGEQRSSGPCSKFYALICCACATRVFLFFFVVSRGWQPRKIWMAINKLKFKFCLQFVQNCLHCSFYFWELFTIFWQITV